MASSRLNMYKWAKVYSVKKYVSRLGKIGENKKGPINRRLPLLTQDKNRKKWFTSITGFEHKCWLIVGPSIWVLGPNFDLIFCVRRQMDKRVRALGNGLRMWRPRMKIAWVSVMIERCYWKLAVRWVVMLVVPGCTMIYWLGYPGSIAL